MKALLTNSKVKLYCFAASFLSILFFPSMAFAKDDEEGSQFDFGGLQKVIAFLVDILLVVAPALIILSMVWSAFLWTMAGTNKKMVDKAKKQFIASVVCLAIIGGYFLIKNLILGFALGSFDEGTS